MIDQQVGNSPQEDRAPDNVHSNDVCTGSSRLASPVPGKAALLTYPVGSSSSQDHAGSLLAFSVLLLLRS